MYRVLDHLLIVVPLLIVRVSPIYSDVVRVGALVVTDDGDPGLTERAFKYGIEQINADRVNYSIILAPQVERIFPGIDSFSASENVCRLFGRGSAVIFGPRPTSLADHVVSMADYKSVPVLETRPRRLINRNVNVVNLHPDPDSLVKAYSDVVLQMGWDKATALYEDNDGLMRIQHILTQAAQSDIISSMRLQRLPHDHGYRYLLRKLRDEGETNFIVDASLPNIYRLLKHAQTVGMVTTKFSYFITALDFQTLDLEDFRYGGSNITGLRLLDPYSLTVGEAVARWRALDYERSGKYVNDISGSQITTEAALTYDGVLLFARALQEFGLPAVQEAGWDCDSDKVWPYGETVINFMKTVSIEGLTGSISFDSTGVRRSFQLDLVQLQEQGLVKIGSWSSDGVAVEAMRGSSDGANSLQPVHNIVVTTIMKKPYTMLKRSSIRRAGNDRYEGICVDLMDLLSEMHDFNYTLLVNADGSAGKPDPESGLWNGMIGDLLSQRADLAIADLTITASRGRAINFTTQWMSLGISLVYVQPGREPPSLFTFLSPFSFEVWSYMGMSMVCIAWLMFFLARFSPFEWSCQALTGLLVNDFGLANSFWFVCGSVMQQGCDILPKFSPYEWRTAASSADQWPVLENSLNLLNALWFMISSLMQQGSDVAPKALSTRLIAGTWWAFTLIMVSSYTANLAAFLTVETVVPRLHSAEDLLRPENAGIRFGFYSSGSTAEFFRNSKVEPYNRMWDIVNSSPSVLKGSDKRGINAVEEAAGRYAYFMESSSIEYYVARRCKLTQVGALLDNKGYGIAVGPRSPVSATDLSASILQLQEHGVLSQLKLKWWKGKSEQNCAVKKSTRVQALTLKNVGGVFVCLLAGLCLAVICAMVEFTLAVYSASVKSNTRFRDEFGSELRFVARLSGSVKPVRRPVTLGYSGGDTLHDSGIISHSSGDESLVYSTPTLRADYRETAA